jgi:hypothetical protein
VGFDLYCRILKEAVQRLAEARRLHPERDMI